MSVAHMCQLAPVLSIGSLIIFLFSLFFEGGVDSGVADLLITGDPPKIQRCLCLVFIGTRLSAVCHMQSDTG